MKEFKEWDLLKEYLKKKQEKGSLSESLIIQSIIRYMEDLESLRK